MTKKNIKSDAQNTKSYEDVGGDFFDEFWNESWTYIKTVVDVVQEPVLLLDEDCIVLAANKAFYELFGVKQKNTEGKLIYDLGNGQWDIPALRNLLVDILPKDTSFKGFEVQHNFPLIGERTVILNARNIHSKDASKAELFPPIIMIAFDDVSEMMSMADKLTKYTNKLEKTMSTRTQNMEVKIAALEKKIAAMTKK